MEDTIREARAALAEGDPQRAESLALEALQRSPGRVRALVTAGEAATSLNRPERALAYYEQIENDGSVDALVGFGAAGDLLLKMGRLSGAEHWYEKVLICDPQHTVAHRRLATMLTLTGRRRESIPHLLQLVRSGELIVDELALLGDLHQNFERPDVLEHFRKGEPDNPLLQFGEARLALRREEFAEAEKLLRMVTTRRPRLIEAQACLGRVLVTLGEPEKFRQWHAALPPEADADPDIWSVRGQWSRNRRQLPEAARCYWEALRRDANAWKANYHLSQVLQNLNVENGADAFLQRAERLKALGETLRLILKDRKRPDLMLRAAKLTESLGRPWEAWAWYSLAAALQPENSAVQKHRDRLKRILTPETPQTLPTANPASDVDLSHYPVPKWINERPVPSTGPAARDPRRAPLPRPAFIDLASAAGIDFRYYNGDDPQKEGMTIWESLGGGVAVLDFDGDAWPDLYFTQGCDWPPDPRQNRHVDRLYRNVAGGRFEEVTGPAALGDSGYSHGVAVGDINGDGFPDLYVANIGQNRLYRNNGDGTFTDMSGTSGITGDQWTTSCLLADLNGDGFPEIYDVNYLARPEPFEEFCHDEKTGLPRSCSPKRFAAEQDRLYLNLQDGSFADVTARSGIRASDGKGLGILAADLDGSGRLDLYVANDTTANFYLVNRSRHAGEPPVFTEQAIPAGCAWDRNGRPQGGMGIAFGDVDGDALFDLFVTNFDNEYNTLYVQIAPGLFGDATEEARLARASIAMLAFGTQFLDAELDGRPDLVVANGSVDDYRFAGKEFHMRPQYFFNRGDGRFEELSADSLGDYFRRKWLGRGLARLDWNRDGREDFAVSHLYAPAALVTNRTAPAGHFIALQFRGVAANRDAIGTVVRIIVGGEARVAQLASGDGYCCSNERRVVFGLGESNRIEQLIIDWPSGRRQTFSDLAADQELLLIEGRDQPLPTGT